MHLHEPVVLAMDLGYEAQKVLGWLLCFALFVCFYCCCFFLCFFFLLVWLIVTAAILQFIRVLLQLLACGHNPFTPNTVSFALFLALITNWSPLLFCALQTPSSSLCPQQTE